MFAFSNLLLSSPNLQVCLLLYITGSVRKPGLSLSHGRRELEKSTSWLSFLPKWDRINMLFEEKESGGTGFHSSIWYLSLQTWSTSTEYMISSSISLVFIYNFLFACHSFSPPCRSRQTRSGSFFSFLSSFDFGRY